MLSAQQASAIVLDLHKESVRDGGPERFVIQSCELSPNGDYWIIRCNTEDCVVHGKTEYCYVGVNAHLVEVRSGALETVASCFSIEEYLRDKDDLRAAAGESYVLMPAFSRESKAALINLRQKLECSYPDSFSLLSVAGRRWFTGKRRHLEDVQRLLNIEGIATDIKLQADPQGAITIGPETWHIDAVLKALHKKRRQLGDSDQ
ncbi:MULTISPECIES: hypothetical protein [Pseudomonas]|jgi:hypothetical protein|uniref:hypothetical protein n=1 Tax=Pseudomonas TaxID=286 RepID=UPI000F030CD5|nr:MULTISPECIES: hypothetical protein [unclassified Pseudomonas]WPN63677.1 hypothetical protein QMK48_00430 [Pseudomonas sp. P9_32]WPN69429.1 hypothetical protein QMK47_01335 [Pseudomonas sp. P9_35]